MDWLNSTLTWFDNSIKSNAQSKKRAYEQVNV